MGGCTLEWLQLDRDLHSTQHDQRVFRQQQRLATQARAVRVPSTGTALRLQHAYAAAKQDPRADSERPTNARQSEARTAWMPQIKEGCEGCKSRGPFGYMAGDGLTHVWGPVGGHYGARSLVAAQAASLLLITTMVTPGLLESASLNDPACSIAAHTL